MMIMILIGLIVFCGSARGQDKIDVTFEVGEDKIFIFYYLQGDPDKTYDVNAVLRKSGDPAFRMIPKEMSGDLGEGKFANRKSTIIWNMNKDEEAALEGVDFYFEVTAGEVNEKSSWYWYVLGAAAAGGGAAAYLLLSKDKSSSPSAPPGSGINPGGGNVAMPPGRP